MLKRRLPMPRMTTARRTTHRTPNRSTPRLCWPQPRRTLDGRSVRGEATIELAPGFEFSTSFESDAEGDLAATVELPPGMDPEFPGGAEAEMRYVGSVVYLRPPVTAETLAALGVDEAWYIVEPIGDPMAEAMQSAGGVMCIFPQAIDEPFADCDPLSDTGYLP